MIQKNVSVRRARAAVLVQASQKKGVGTYEGGFDNALNALGSHLGVNGDERTSWYYTWSATSNKVAGQAGVRHVAIMIYSAESAAALCQSSAQPGTPYHAY